MQPHRTTHLKRASPITPQSVPSQTRTKSHTQMPPWHRPKSLERPQTWHSFKTIDPDTSQLARYHVQDLPEECREEAVDLLGRHFLPDEPLCRALRIPEDPTSSSELRRIWRELTGQRIAQVCYREASDEIVALDLLNVVGKGDRLEVQSERLGRVFKVGELLCERGDLFERYKAEFLLSSGGLLVMPKYRGFKIATEMLRTRRVICEAMGLKLSATVFTSPGSQTAAKKVGFKEEVVMSYEELRTEHDFPEVNYKFVKLMTLLVE
uniref:(northern house mosquito) hypothetical protein n=1 Tax=Culex pipiens TaxID=7175 RepID=A0A8D8C4G9_CULPI